MRELQLDGIHEDGEHAVLTDSDGAQYTLRIDDALRAAVRRDRPALGMIQATAAAPLRPRDIQAQLRAGRAAEDIATASGIDIEHIRRYEGPVLAERRWIAERAASFHVGRGGGPALGELVQQRLRARRAESETRWDAWRLDDGTWTVELIFRAGGRERAAHWNVDMIRQSVTADDDEARWLTDDDIAPREDSSTAGRARLTAVRRGVFDVEAEGNGASAPPQRRHDTEPIDEQELSALNARRGLRPVAPLPADEDASVWTSLDETAGDGDDDADADAAREHAREPRRPTLLRSARSAVEDDEHDELSGHAADESTGSTEDSSEEHRGASRATAGTDEVDLEDLTPLPGFEPDSADSGSGSETTSTDRPAPSTTAKPKRSKRASMPSWDEIVFGKKND